MCASLLGVAKGQDVPNPPLACSRGGTSSSNAVPKHRAVLRGAICCESGEELLMRCCCVCFDLHPGLLRAGFTAKLKY